MSVICANNYPAEKRGWAHPLGPWEQPLSRRIYWNKPEKYVITAAVHITASLRLPPPCQGVSILPTVLHKVNHDLVQDLLKQGGADPQVFGGVGGQAGQPGQPSQAVLALQALGSPEEGVRTGQRTLRQCLYRANWRPLCFFFLLFLQNKMKRKTLYLKMSFIYLYMYIYILKIFCYINPQTMYLTHSGAL